MTLEFIFYIFHISYHCYYYLKEDMEYDVKFICYIFHISNHFLSLLIRSHEI